MPHSANNLYNVLLLFALGYLIYYLMNSNKQVKSENKKQKTDKLVNNTLYGDMDNEPNKEQFANNDNYEKNALLNNMNQPKAHNGLENLEYFADNKIIKSPPTNANANEMPVTKTNTNTSVVKSITDTDMVSKVNNFNAFDDDYTPYTNLDGKIDSYGISVDWSDLQKAFQPLVDKPNTKDVVKMNNPEMKKYNSDDFLPKEVIEGAFEDFSQAKYNLDNNNLINTDRYVIGINTVGQSLKNGSHDIRGTIPNPKFSVSPWNNSTYEPDYNIKPLY